MKKTTLNKDHTFIVDNFTGTTGHPDTSLGKACILIQIVERCGEHGANHTLMKERDYSLL